LRTYRRRTLRRWQRSAWFTGAAFGGPSVARIATDHEQGWAIAAVPPLGARTVVAHEAATARSLGVATRRNQLGIDLTSDASQAQRRRSRRGDRADAATQAPSPRIALTRAEAATALGISIDSFERHVQPEIRLVRRNSIRLVPVFKPKRRRPT
jgi:hypothetical protein